MGRSQTRVRRTLALAFCCLALASGCGVEKPPGGRPPTAVIHQPTNQVDVLFVVANFLRGWVPATLAREMPRFMNALQELPGGMPSLHLGVTSASLGAGAFSTVPRCADGTNGNAEGRLQYPEQCAPLASDERFLATSGDGTADNFQGDPAAIASCMLGHLGEDGCPFGQPLAAASRALRKGGSIDDPDNGRFLRPDANLAVVLVSNVDDCSVPSDSTLFDPGVDSLDHPSGLGLLSSYRCAEFGHLCEGQPPPHSPAAGSPALSNCVPAEEKGRLAPVSGFVESLRALKPGRPDRVLVGATVAPSMPYSIRQLFPYQELRPALDFSCEGENGASWGTPSVRIAHWVAGFGPRGVQGNVCAHNFAAFVLELSTLIGKAIAGGACLDHKPPSGVQTTAKPIDPSRCEAFEEQIGPSDGGRQNMRRLPVCDPQRTALPCWELDPLGRSECDHVARVCYDAACTATAQPSTTAVSVHCAPGPPTDSSTGG